MNLWRLFLRLHDELREDELSEQEDLVAEHERRLNVHERRIDEHEERLRHLRRERRLYDQRRGNHAT